MNKPLHKDLSFWIVAVTVLGAASVTQLYYGIPWFTGKIASLKPAPRVEPLASPISYASQAGGARILQPTNPPHAPGEWQLPYREQNILQTAPAQVAILPSKFAQPEQRSADEPMQGGWTMSSGERIIGIRIPIQTLVQMAYRSPGRTRYLWPDAWSGRAPEYYDFIANLPNGALQALQQEIQKKLGLAAERQMILTNALALRVQNREAPGLKPAPTAVATQPPRQTGMLNLRTFTSLASYLEAVLRTPVLDQTGLTGTYDLQVPTTAGATQNLDQLKKHLLDQFGVELSETPTSLEYLVVKKVN